MKSDQLKFSVTYPKFAQTTINRAEVFSSEGRAFYSNIAGSKIDTVNDLVNAIRSGKIAPNQIPIDYVDINGVRLILNTRSSTALERAGVPRAEWFGRNQTGKPAYMNQNTGKPVLFDDLARDQLNRNSLPSTGAKELQSVQRTGQ